MPRHDHNDVTMAKATVSISLPTRLLADLDDKVDNGIYEDRSEAVKKAVEQMLNNNSNETN